MEKEMEKEKEMNNNTESVEQVQNELNNQFIESQNSVEQEDKATEEVRQDDSSKADLSAQEKDNLSEPNLAEELAALQDRFLRLAAEYDNYQKRTQRERLELIKNAGERTIRAFLPVVDDFDRMLAVVQNDQTLSDVVREGFSLIQQKFMRILSELGVKAIEAVGQKFDSNFHEAVGELPAQDESQKGTVLAEVEKGYFLNDKVLRYSKVLIGK
ncbi:MAG: nucleotide exchange factor GrpE [Bacteroidia bacterium]|nr:nucleotide exchange factor GrpE [Bacteroidia bacterium]